MPLLSTSGADCAQGYGFGIGQAGVLTTYTFPSGTSTWTAPPGVTNIVTAAGRGENGVAPSWITGDFTWYALYAGDDDDTTPTGPTLDWSTVYAKATSLLAGANAGGTGERTLAQTNQFYAVNEFNVSLPRNAFTDTYLIRGTATLLNSGGVPTSGQVLYADWPYSAGIVGWYVIVDAYDFGSNGASTTGFGLTFPGGTSSSPVAPTTTFNNTAVVPGTTYTIQNRGSLTITYYV